MSSKKDDILIPDRYPQKDLFICEINDAPFKDINQELEHPFYSLSKKPDHVPRIYEHNGNRLEIEPSMHGLPTIYDKDILVFCISVLMSKLNKGEEISKQLTFSGADFFKFTNRSTSKKDYMALEKSLKRLRGVNITTNIKTGGKVHTEIFGLIDSGRLVRKDEEHEGDNKGRLEHVSVTLSDWVYEAVQAFEVLTLHKDYFRLRKPIEKRVYEVIRKHCGSKQDFMISIEKLHKKTGSFMQLKKFKFTLKDIMKNDHLPGYRIQLIDNMVHVINTEFKEETKSPDINLPNLQTETFVKAKEVAPAFDPYWLQTEWHKLILSKKEKVFDPDKAFLKFCEYRNSALNKS
jgi:plasmid replication initiation protein